MEDSKEGSKNVLVPEIFCALSILLNEDSDISALENDLLKAGIRCQKKRKPKCEPLVRLDLAIIQYERFWELDSALAKMFSTINWSLSQLKGIVNKYRGDIYIDIAFYQYGIYPALTISGDNMKKIRELEANISIDPFDCSEG